MIIARTEIKIRVKLTERVVRFVVGVGDRGFDPRAFVLRVRLCLLSPRAFVLWVWHRRRDPLAVLLLVPIRRLRRIWVDG